MLNKKCLTCAFLGQCSLATYQMVYTGEGCPDWTAAAGEIIWARVQLYRVVGNLAIPVLLKNRHNQEYEDGLHQRGTEEQTESRSAENLL